MYKKDPGYKKGIYLRKYPYETEEHIRLKRALHAAPNRGFKGFKINQHMLI